MRRYPGACPRMTAAAEATYLPNEWHQGELYPRVGFIVTNLNRPPERVVKFYNGRGTAEQWIREGKNALRCTRLSCHAFRHNAVRLQLHALTYNLANFMRTLALPEEVEHLVADHAAREAGQDWRPHRAPWPLRGVPAGRGRSAAGVVRRHPAPDRWPAATVAAAPGVRIGSDERRRPSKRGACMIDQKALLRFATAARKPQKDAVGSLSNPSTEAAGRPRTSKNSGREHCILLRPGNCRHRL